MLNALATSLHIPVDTLISALLLLGKATMLLLLALGVTWVMQRMSAVSRHLVWFASLAAILLMPVVGALSPITVPILPSIPLGVASALVSGSANDNTNANGSPAIDAQRTPAAVRNAATDAERNALRTPTAIDQANRFARSTDPVAPLSIGAWLLGTWAAVAAMLAAWLIVGAYQVTRIVRRATSLRGTNWDAPVYEIADRLALGEAPRLMLSDDIVMPFACGLTTPTIVLPRSAQQWSPEQRSAVLLHEMAHIKRRDLVGHTVGRFACALYWFHPLVWTAAKRLRAESERACDDLALLCGARASDYAEQLLDIVSQVKRNTTPSVALAMANRSEFEGRMLAILDPALRRVAPSRWQSATLVGSVALIAMTIGMAVPAEAYDSTTVIADATSKTSQDTTTEASRVSSDESEKSQPPVASPVRAAKPETAASPSPKPSPRPTPRPVAAPATTPGEGHGDGHGDGHGEVAPRNPTQPISTTTSSRRGEPTEAQLAMASFALIRDAMRLAEKDVTSRNRKPSSSTTKDGGARASILIGILRNDKNSELRRVAAWGLSEFTETPDAVSALATTLRRDSSEMVREMAAWALGEGGASKAGRLALVEAIRNERSASVQCTAIWAIGETSIAHDDAGIEDISKALTSPSTRVREVAAWAIGSIAPKSAPRALLVALSDSDASVRTTAAWALHEIEDPAAVTALDAALRKEKVASVQVALVRALAAHGEAAVQTLSRLIDDPDPTIRSVAVRAIAGGTVSQPWPQPRPQPRPIP